MDRVARVVGAGPGHDRRARRALARRQADQAELLLVGERRGLAGRPGDDEAVRPVRGEVAHEPDEGLLVDLSMLVEGRYDRREDRAEVDHRLQYLTLPAIQKSRLSSP